MAGDGREEVVTLQRPYLGVDNRRHSRRSRDVPEKRYLAEVVSLVRPRMKAFGGDLELAFIDDVEAIARVSRGDQDLPGSNGNRNER